MSNEQTVAELGEFALIEQIAKQLGSGNSPFVEVGVGDDSAVVSAAGGRVVACLDVLSEGVHFRRDWSAAHDIGRKAAAQNLADICAMAARPTALLVGLTLPPETPVAWVLELANGLREEAAALGVSVVGGDLAAGSAINIAVTALGELDGGAPVLRSGAQVGDVVAVTGKLGYSAAGLHLLSRGFRSPRILVAAHRVPEPPYQAAISATFAHAMIDVSDGLVADLAHIARASQVDIDLNMANYAIDQPLADAAAAFNGDAMNWILTGGEDHAFVATFAPDQVPEEWQVIGKVQAGQGQVLVSGENYSGSGWVHFRA